MRTKYLFTIKYWKSELTSSLRGLPSCGTVEGWLSLPLARIHTLPFPHAFWCLDPSHMPWCQRFQLCIWGIHFIIAPVSGRTEFLFSVADSLEAGHVYLLAWFRAEEKGWVMYVYLDGSMPVGALPAFSTALNVAFLLCDAQKEPQCSLQARALDSAR